MCGVVCKGDVRMAAELDDALPSPLDWPEAERGDGGRKSLRIYAQASGSRGREKGTARSARQAFGHER